jgi:hypothetical protein
MGRPKYAGDARRNMYLHIKQACQTQNTLLAISVINLTSHATTCHIPSPLIICKFSVEINKTTQNVLRVYFYLNFHLILLSVDGSAK